MEQLLIDQGRIFSISDESRQVCTFRLVSVCCELASVKHAPTTTTVRHLETQILLERFTFFRGFPTSCTSGNSHRLKVNTSSDKEQKKKKKKNGGKKHTEKKRKKLEVFSWSVWFVETILKKTHRKIIKEKGRNHALSCLPLVGGFGYFARDPRSIIQWR